MADTTIAYYEAQWKDLVKRYESADVSGLQSLLASSFPSGSRLLELGCGSGRDAAFMVSRGFDVTASDAVQEMIDAAADCHKALSGRLCRICLPGDLTSSLGPFDGVYSVATLMHLTRPAIHEVFSRLSLVIVPGGRLFFSVPLQRDDVREDSFDAGGRWFTSLSRSAWADICRHAGFEIIKTTTSSDGLGRESFAWFNCLAVCKNMAEETRTSETRAQSGEEFR